MAKRADVELRIRSRDLSNKSIDEVTKKIDALNTKLREQQDAAKIAAVSVKDLKNQQRLLADASSALSARRGDIEALQRQQAEIAQTTAALNKYRRELAELRMIQRSGNYLGDIDSAIKRVGHSVKASETLLNKQQSAFNRAADRAREYGINVDNLGESLQWVEHLQTEVAQALEKTNASFDRRERVLKEAATAQEKQEKATREAIAAEQRLQQELADTLRFEQARDEARRRFRVEESRRGFEEGFAAREAREREITEEVRRRDRLEREAHAKRIAEARAEAEARAASYARLRQAVETFQNATRSQLRNPETRAAVVEEQKLLNTRRQLRGATSEQAQRTRQLADEQRRLNNQTRTALSFNQRLRGQILSIAAAYFGVFEAINTVRRSIQTDIERQGTAMRLQVAAGGDIRAAGDAFAYVREQADRLGQRLDPLAAQYSKFAIAAQGAGQSLETTQQVFENFAEVGTVLQLSQENMDGIFKALEQSFSKGIVQAEELRGQLGDRLPGAFTKLASAIGVSNGELTKLMENGELTANVLPLLGEFLADEVAGSLPEAVSNTRAELGRLRTALDDFLVSLSRGGLGDAIRELSIQIREFFNSQDGKQFAQDLAISFRMAVNVLSSIVSVLGGPGGVITLLKAMVAIKVASWAGQWATGMGAMVLRLTELRRGMDATGVAARTMGTRIMAALGPIGIALALAAEAFIYFKSKSDAAADAAEAQAKRVDELRTAQGRALQSALALAEQDIENARASKEAAIEKRRQAQATLANVRAQIAELKAAGKFTEVTGFIRGERQTRLSPEASALVAQYNEAQAAIKDAEAAIDDFNKSATEAALARDRLMKESWANEAEALRQFAALDAELKDETNRKKFLSDKAYYDDVNDRARAAFKLLGEASREYVKQSTLDQQEALQNTLGKLRAQRAGLDFSILDKDAEDKDAERLARERERAEERRIALANRTKEALLQVERDIAEAQIDENAKTMDAIDANLRLRMDAIDAEINKRISDLQELRRDAEKEGTPESVANVDQALAEVERLRVLEKQDAAYDALYEKFQLQESTLNDLIDERAAKVEYINTLREAGHLTDLEAQQQIRDVMIEGQDAIAAKAQELRDFLLANQDALSKFLNVDEILLKLDALSVKLEVGKTAAEKFLHTWRGEIAGGIADTFAVLGAGLADFLKGVGGLSDAFKSAADAFLSFAADFLVNIGKMIMQAIILQAIKNALTGGTGGFWDAALGAIGVAHNGAIVGAPMGSSMAISPLAFAGAPRYHNGGFPGLRSDEVPVIAQTGEEILSRTDPRNALNGGATPKTPDLKIINAIDSDSVVNEALSRRSGQVAYMNVIRARKAEIKQILGV